MNRLVVLMLAGTLMTTPVTLAAAQDPLDQRVTIDYRNAAATEVLGALARAAGLAIDVSAGEMRPVTITLTNVRLGNALNAVCDNASCTWHYGFQGNIGGLKVTPVASDRNVGLPPSVSLDLQDTPASDVFRALAAAIDVPVSVDPGLPTGAVNLTFKSAATAEVLDMLCNIQKCEWSFDPTNGLRVTRKK